MSKFQKAARESVGQGLDKTILWLLVLGLFLFCLPGRAQEEGEEEFKGIGLHVKLKGAWVMFGGGDIDKGTAGMFDRDVAEMVSAGFIPRSDGKKPFGNGYELGGDVVYYFTPKIGVGAGGSLIRAHQESAALFHWPGSTDEYRLSSLPEMEVISIRLGLFYALPLNRLLTVCISAGPEYYSADYEYGGSITTPYYAGSVVQRASAQKLGLHGGLSLEIRMNRRLAFCLEALGRYARISGFEGKEATYEWAGGQSTTLYDEGVLYFLEEAGYPKLDIPSAGAPAGQGAREAVFDLSGVSIRLGLNFKF